MLFPIQATGGSGRYVWSCKGTEVISIDSGGVVTARMKGSSSVRATDAANSLHYGTAAVSVRDFCNYIICILYYI